MNIKNDKKIKREYVKYAIISLAVLLLICDCIYLINTNNMIVFEKIGIVSIIIACIGLLIFTMERKNEESRFKQEQDRMIYDAILELPEEKKIDLLKDLINME